jgi:hypothetical protein
MAGKLNKFQKQTFSHWKGDNLKKAFLGGIFQEKPQMATNLMVQLLAFHTGKTLNTFISQFPTKTFDSEDEYTWNIIGSNKRNIPLAEARDCDGNVIDVDATKPNVGVGGEPFFLVFDEDWFYDGEVIVGDLNEIYPILIQGNPRNEGTKTVYKCQVWGSVPGGIPRERLQAGERFSVEYAPVERDFSRKVGGIRMSSPVAMRNEFSKIRIQTKVSGAMLGEKVAFGIPVIKETNGRYTHTVENMWMHVVQWELEKQWDEYKNYILAFGRSNRNSNGEYLNFGKSGEAIRTGAGLYEQMEVSNTMFYNDFSLKLIEDALYELSAAKLGFGERTFVLKTGERGATQFHKAVLDTVSGWQAFITTNSDAVGMVQKTNSPLHNTALSAGFQFVEFRAPNGVTVKVDVDPYYDDPVRNKVMHPNGGPAFSYRYDIFDIGTMDQPNIFKCAVKGQEGDMTSYQWGLRNPFTGQMGNPYMSHDEDSATIHKMTTTGICVLDPTRTMSLIPAILAA